MSNLKKLQNWLKENSIDAFMVSRTDEFLSENIASYAERLKWISNFSGSSGKAVIMQDTAGIFVDGRYTIQIRKQIDENCFIIKHLDEFESWLKLNLKIDYILGLDPNLHSTKEIQSIKKISYDKGAKIKYLDFNPIDLLWHDQPLPPQSKAFIHDFQYNGKSAQEKIFQVRSTLKSNQCDYYILTALDSIAWLLNLRGNDILYTPLNLAYIIITPSNKIELFINKLKIKDIQFELHSYVNFHSIEEIKDYITKLKFNVVIGIDKNKTPFIFEKICSEHSIKFKYLFDPCVYPKAKKNNTELQGARNANIRDGVSITKFCYWLKNEMVIKETDELIASQKLFSLRKKNTLFYSLSFNTISAIGEHAALPHYSVTKSSNLPFKKNNIYLFDSGAQYFDGTTDITRTVIIGKPSSEQKDRFTRVLKGHIAIASCTFPNEMKGFELDPIARKSLIAIGCDYDHGTGHGIGSFLCVHEGPQKISKPLSGGLLLEGMILSNEPGFYKIGQYGIRIENLIIVKKKSSSTMGFETISWAPIDLDLIDKSLLVSREKEWLNSYHKKVFKKLGDLLSINEKTWLEEVTQPIQ